MIETALRRLGALDHVDGTATRYRSKAAAGLCRLFGSGTPAKDEVAYQAPSNSETDANLSSQGETDPACGEERHHRWNNQRRTARRAGRDQNTARSCCPFYAFRFLGI